MPEQLREHAGGREPAEQHLEQDAAGPRVEIGLRWRFGRHDHQDHKDNEPSYSTHLHAPCRPGETAAVRLSPDNYTAHSTSSPLRPGIELVHGPVSGASIINYCYAATGMYMTAAAAVLRESANTRTSRSHKTTRRTDTKMSRRVSRRLAIPRHRFTVELATERKGVHEAKVELRIRIPGICTGSDRLDVNAVVLRRFGCLGERSGSHQ